MIGRHIKCEMRFTITCCPHAALARAYPKSTDIHIKCRGEGGLAVSQIGQSPDSRGRTLNQRGEVPRRKCCG